ncbi:unnamed protein product [Rangifer tarandus platyrhynchus]|uniref:Uncharacterized protein n=2 Tax=Rangifer tarandus platyrhynchus TaxID=3082113 RepID=A0AC59Z8H1_RANTA|nr:unnamed protein product [Rangifer tarandus platyrhynchus]
MPNPGPGEIPAAAAASPPALPEVIEPLPRRALIPVAEASGQHFQDPAPAELPKLYLPLPISRMPFSAYTSPQHHSPSLPLNGKIQSGAPNSSSPGLPYKGLGTPQPSLGKPWLLTWTHSIWKSLDVGSYSTWMTCCWLLRPRKNVGKGQKPCSSC